MAAKKEIDAQLLVAEAMLALIGIGAEECKTSLSSNLNQSRNDSGSEILRLLTKTNGVPQLRIGNAKRNMLYLFILLKHANHIEAVKVSTHTSSLYNRRKASLSDLAEMAVEYLENTEGKQLKFQ